MLHLEPVHPEARPFVAALGGPQRHIRLLGKEFPATIVAFIVDHEKVTDTDPAIVVQEIGKANVLVSKGREDEDVVGLHPGRVITDNAKLARLATGADKPSLPL